jgi:sec-independent protein translocase protein TatC
MAEAPTADDPAAVDDPAEIADLEERARLLAEAELEAGRMPFVEHLRELRVRLRNSIAALIVGFAVAFAFSETLFAMLSRPLVAVWTELAASNPAVGEPAFYFTSLLEPFWVYLSIALWGGLFVASPVVFLEIWKFIAPGLYRHERRYGVAFAACSTVLFVGGAAFCYAFILPAAFRFFLSYSTSNLAGIGDASSALSLAPLLGMDAYLSFAKKLLLAFGLVFELPLVITFLAIAGAVTHRGLWRFNRWFVVLSFVVAALLTPGPDVISQVGMALPLIALYNLSIIIAWLITRKRERAAAALDQEPGPGAA